MDTQTIELLGRNRLMTELLHAGLEVAQPARDRGIELIAYVDLESRVNAFVACPIQMKAASTRAFSLNRKYSKISNLILAYVWGLKEPEKAVTYAMTFHEALAIAGHLNDFGLMTMPSRNARNASSRLAGEQEPPISVVCARNALTSSWSI